ncbi:MAG: HK97 gp10 family phage protein [Bacteroidales bacterium]|nr:HK97 gp10 family phage protein [Bacteroidales bacterium]
MAAMEYDISELEKLFGELSEKERVKALKGAFRKGANRFRKAAIQDLRSSVNSNREMEKGVRALVFKKTAGFRVTVGTKMKRSKGKVVTAGYYANRQVRKNPSKYSPKPVLLWFEDGTRPRRTKSNGGKHTRLFAERSRASHGTGRIDAAKFMVTARDRVASGITDDLHNDIQEYVIRTAKKHGCKV